MQKVILLCLLISLSAKAYNQIIKGTIFDNKTKEIVYSASVYINGTSVGTLSDQNGNFKLDISKYRLMPFFRALWLNDLGANGFLVRNTANETLSYEKIVFIKDSHTKYLNYHTDLGISYYTKQPTSFVIFKKSQVYFEASGYFDPSLISWEGEISRKRIADQLPFEYFIK